MNLVTRVHNLEKEVVSTPGRCPTCRDWPAVKMSCADAEQEPDRCPDCGWEPLVVVFTR